MSTPAVAVVDIGSNSIKLLVTTRGADGSLVPLAQRTEDTRIGTGITGNPPRLNGDAMARALVSIRLLLAEAAPFAPREIRLVATSAVRDAANGADFRARVLTETGHAIAILAGAEEARLIGRGIACDPALRGVEAFYLFDLGGGSLEMLEFRAGRVEQLTSLQLGCVRLTERCVSDSSRPLDAAVRDAIRDHTREVIAGSGFRFTLPAPAAAVATGGTATTFRLIDAATRAVPFSDASPVMPIAQLEALAARLCSQSLDERRAMPGMPPARADVFPTALLTLGEVARLAEVAEFRHSFFNLRFGLAAELLDTL